MKARSNRRWSAPASVLARFPQYREVIEQLSGRGVFRSLCRDYADCVKARAHWAASTSEKAGERAAEYTDLLIELEQEMLIYFQSKE